tara:strand:+ start:7939 stop:8565 length:627 start_codon:yes stop_codon:yes gene_type:complete
VQNKHATLILSAGALAMARQDNSFFVAFLTSLIVSIGTTLVMYFVVLPRLAPYSRMKSNTVSQQTVPKLEGLQLSQAKLLLKGMNLQLGLAGQKNGPKPAGTILSHMPEQGSPIKRGGEVKVVISLGPKAPKKRPETPPAPQKVKVPSVRNMHIRKAKQKVKDAGLIVGRIIYGYDEDISPNWVLRQSPRAGRMVEKGSKVKITINKE